jgi:hypothetical protein
LEVECCCCCCCIVLHCVDCDDAPSSCFGEEEDSVLLGLPLGVVEV